MEVVDAWLPAELGEPALEILWILKDYLSERELRRLECSFAYASKCLSDLICFLCDLVVSSEQG